MTWLVPDLSTYRCALRRQSCVVEPGQKKQGSRPDKVLYLPLFTEVRGIGILRTSHSTSSPTQQPRLALLGERVGQLIVCWHKASQVEVFTLERQARTDKFTEV